MLTSEDCHNQEDQVTYNRHLVSKREHVHHRLARRGFGDFNQGKDKNIFFKKSPKNLITPNFHRLGTKGASYDVLLNFERSKRLTYKRIWTLVVL